MRGFTDDRDSEEKVVCHQQGFSLSLSCVTANDVGGTFRTCLFGEHQVNHREQIEDQSKHTFPLTRSMKCKKNVCFTENVCFVVFLRMLLRHLVKLLTAISDSSKSRKRMI